MRKFCEKVKTPEMEELGDFEGMIPEEFQSDCQINFKGSVTELPKGWNILLGIQKTGAVLSSGILKSTNFKKATLSYVNGVDIADVYFYEGSEGSEGSLDPWIVFVFKITLHSGFKKVFELLTDLVVKAEPKRVAIVESLSKNVALSLGLNVSVEQEDEMESNGHLVLRKSNRTDWHTKSLAGQLHDSICS